jgi:hypothetical protein
MKVGGTKRVLVAALAGVLGWGVVSVYGLRVARGDVFPEYSSLRADPLGVRALHDAVGRLPGREVVRWTRPVQRLVAGEGDLLIVAGVNRIAGGLSEEEEQALDRAAIAGARVLVAWRAESARPGDGEVARQARKELWGEKKLTESASKKGEKSEPKVNEAAEKKDAKKPTQKEKEADEAKAEKEKERENEPPSVWASKHERRWGYRLLRRELVTRDEQPDATSGEAVPAGWPKQLASWRSDLFFLARAGEGWRTLYRRGGDTVMMTRARGAGEVTLMADSFPLSNEAAQRERASALLAGLLGEARRVIFLETHLGVETEEGVAVLARRYGLSGAAFMALILAGLWFWRQGSSLAPPLEEEAQIRLKIAPTAGLEALLRRAVPLGRLHATCVTAWTATASAAERQRFQQAVAAEGKEPVAAYRAVQRALAHRVGAEKLSRNT